MDIRHPQDHSQLGEHAVVSLGHTGDPTLDKEQTDPWPNDVHPVLPWEDYSATDVDDVNECHRSPRAYPQLFTERLGFGTGILGRTFYACGDAKVVNLTDPPGQWGEGKQLDKVWTYASGRGEVDPEVDLVTLPIGLEGVGLPGLTNSCVDPHLNGVCEFSVGLAESSMILLDGLDGDVFAEIHARVPNARIRVVGYPDVLGDPTQPAGPTDPGRPCHIGIRYIGSAPATRTVNNTKRQYLHDYGRELLRVLQQEVQQAQAAHPGLALEFVHLTDDFAGHDVCKPDRWINQWYDTTPSLINPGFVCEGGFLPNRDGQAAIEEALYDSLLP